MLTAELANTRFPLPPRLYFDKRAGCTEPRRRKRSSRSTGVIDNPGHEPNYANVPFNIRSMRCFCDEKQDADCEIVACPKKGRPAGLHKQQSTPRIRNIMNTVVWIVSIAALAHLGQQAGIGKCSGRNWFNCGDGNCIEAHYRCDGIEDCENWKDELDCPIPKCSSGRFLCEPLKKCLPNSILCDHIRDCPDGSDETDCENRTCDGFRCKDHKCIRKEWECDGDADCKDGSDEEHCPVPECPEDTVLCLPKKKCLRKFLVCDFSVDCPDGSDERDCEQHECDGFKCRNHECINEAFRCDRDYDCVDGSDEEDCPLPKCSDAQIMCLPLKKCLSMVSVRCDGQRDCPDGSDEDDCKGYACDWGFQCQNGKCIHKHWRCDGDEDCEDGSDEADCPP